MQKIFRVLTATAFLLTLSWCCCAKVTLAGQKAPVCHEHSVQTPLSCSIQLSSNDHCRCRRNNSPAISTSNDQKPAMTALVQQFGSQDFFDDAWPVQGMYAPVRFSPRGIPLYLLDSVLRL